jgi:hypothetical protein
VSAGPLLFARYGYPPNALGYCGPGDTGGLLELGATSDSRNGGNRSKDERTAVRDIAARARSFDGAWPYLELIAAANRIPDPLDPRVVNAYWIGNVLLDAVTPALLGSSVESRFRRRAGRGWDKLTEALPELCRPHHSFHVFAVYPWIGLLRAGHVNEPLRVLDQCRIRWGVVEEVRGDLVLVWSRPLAWDGVRLVYGPARLETATLASGGLGFVKGLRPGEWVSLHWDWVCDRVTDRQRRALRHYSALSLAAVNNSPHPAPAAVLS